MISSMLSNVLSIYRFYYHFIQVQRLLFLLRIRNQKETPILEFKKIHSMFQTMIKKKKLNNKSKVEHRIKMKSY